MRCGVIFSLVLLSPLVCAAESVPLLVGIEQHIGLILLIAAITIMALMIMMLFYLHSISEHLNWIRRVR